MSEISKWQKFVLFTCNKYVASLKCEKKPAKNKACDIFTAWQKKTLSSAVPRKHRERQHRNKTVSNQKRPLQFAAMSENGALVEHR